MATKINVYDIVTDRIIAELEKGKDRGQAWDQEHLTGSARDHIAY